MRIFVCHSSRDGAAVRSLVSDLDVAPATVWLDHELTGGDAWWSSILEQIRSSNVFMLALSQHALQSKPCQAEWAYADKLRLPILPVQVGEVESYRVPSIFKIQSIDYRKPTARTGIALMCAVQECAAQPRKLPDPLPDEPAIPYEYLQKLGLAIDGSDVISHVDQAVMLSQLRQVVRDEEDESVRSDILVLLRSLRKRPEVTYATVNEIDVLVGEYPSRGRKPGESVHKPTPSPSEGSQPAKQAPPKAKDRDIKETSKPAPSQPAGGPPAGWYPDPAGNPKKIRYWDGKQWTDHFAPA
jgi:hypothetical protein